MRASKCEIARTIQLSYGDNGGGQAPNALSHALQADFQDVRCIDASKLDWYPSHHRPVSLKREEADAKGSKADTEGNKDTSGFQFKVFTLCYLTSFDEVRCLVGTGSCSGTRGGRCNAHPRPINRPLRESTEPATKAFARTAQPSKSLGTGLCRLSGLCHILS